MSTFISPPKCLTDSLSSYDYGNPYLEAPRRATLEACVKILVGIGEIAAVMIGNLLTDSLNHPSGRKRYMEDAIREEKANDNPSMVGKNNI